MHIKYSKNVNMKALGRNFEWRKKTANEQKKLAYKSKVFVSKIYVCPICSSSNLTLYISIYKYNYSKCSNCKHIFCSSPLDENSIKKLYTSEIGEPSIQREAYISDELFTKRLKDIANPKINFVNKTLISLGLKNEGLWIDLGSGAGEILKAAEISGWKALGFESDKAEYLFALSKNLKVYNKYLSIEALDIISSYNPQVVSLFNIVEHIINPLDFLRNLSSKISDSTIVFEVPRHPSISSLISEAYPDKAYRHIYPPDHLHIFSEESLLFMAKELGYKIVAKWFYGQDFTELISSIFWDKKISTNSVFEDVISKSSAIQKAIDKSGLSDTVIVILRK
jgi:hypothetical protein